MPGVTANTFQQAIKMRRDEARGEEVLNADRVPLPKPTEWLLDCIDFSEVADVGTEHRERSSDGPQGGRDG